MFNLINFLEMSAAEFRRQLSQKPSKRDSRQNQQLSLQERHKFINNM